MNRRILVVLAVPVLSIGGCSGAEAVEDSGVQQEAVGARPVDPNTGQPVNPITWQPMDDYPIGYCTYVCSLGKRWVAMTNACKSPGVCEDLGSQECTQEWRKTPFDDRACAKEVQRGCVNPNIKLP